MSAPLRNRWLVRLIARLIPTRYRDDITSDVIQESETAGRGVAPTLWHLLRSARDCRRVAATARRTAPIVDGRAATARLAWLPHLRDLRIAARGLWRARTLTGTIIVILALAIGGTTAMFSVVHAVLIAPLPYASPASLVRLWERHVPRGRERNVVSPANLIEWRERSRTLTDFAGFGYDSVSITGDGPPERVTSVTATWNLFSVLGVAPAAGRAFTADDGIPTAERVVAISWELWQRRYAGDSAIVNRTIVANGAPARVVGILPAGFALFGNRADVWAVMRPTNEWRQPRGRSLEALARLAPGVTLEDAQAELDVIAAGLEQQWPDFNAGWRVRVVSAHEDLAGDLRRPLVLLFVAVGIVLLAGCANAANLLIARAADRRREFEVRAALGASRARLLAELGLEGLLLGAAGTVAGVGVAAVLLKALVRLAESSFGVPRLDHAALNLPVLGLALALLLLCTLAFALAPRWLATRAAASNATASTRRWTPGPVERRVRAGLVIAQVAFAVVLVVCAGLVGRSLLRLMAVDPGFDPARVLTLTVSLPSAAYSSEAQVRFFDRAAEALRALPGVERVGAISWIPFGGPGGATSYDVEGRPPLLPGARPVADIRPIDTGYFAAMRIPLRRGRTFTRDEVLSGARVAIVNEAVVRDMFPGEDPIGQRLRVNWNDGVDEIVGVVGDVRIASLATPVRSQIYFPQSTANVGFVSYVVRTSVDETTLSRSVVTAIQSIDANLPVRNVQPMQALIDRTTAAPRLAAWLVAAFGALSLLLAGVGVGGLQAASVAARRQEFGIRLALGATPGAIRGIVLRQAAVILIIGFAAGFLASLLVSSAAATLLADASTADLPLYAATAALVVTLGFAASATAIRRATATSPADTLRS